MSFEGNLDRFLMQIGPKALTFARYRSDQMADAEEIVQEAMLKFCLSYANKPSDQWTPLFYKVLRNKAIDAGRASQMRKLRGWLFSTNDDTAETVLEPDTQTPEAWVTQGERAQQLETALRALPDRQREVFMLRVWEGLSTEDAATAMSISTGSVKTHLSRAMAQLNIDGEQL